MKRLLSGVLAALMWSLLTTTLAIGGDAMQLSSTAFKDGGKVGVQYAMPGAGGKNVSFPLVWQNAPVGTRSLALAIVDPHPVAKNWVHWLVINLPAQTSGLPEGASNKTMPVGAVELRNSFGAIGYGGPQPPPGTGDHPYVVTVYALDVDKLELAANTSLAAFQKALEGHVLATATITGMYGR